MKLHSYVLISSLFASDVFSLFFSFIGGFCIGKKIELKEMTLLLFIQVKFPFFLQKILLLFVLYKICFQNLHLNGKNFNTLLCFFS